MGHARDPCRNEQPDSESDLPGCHVARRVCLGVEAVASDVDGDGFGHDDDRCREQQPAGPSARQPTPLGCVRRVEIETRHHRRRFDVRCGRDNGVQRSSTDRTSSRMSQRQARCVGGQFTVERGGHVFPFRTGHHTRQCFTVTAGGSTRLGGHHMAALLCRNRFGSPSAKIANAAAPVNTIDGPLAMLW